MQRLVDSAEVSINKAPAELEKTAEGRKFLALKRSHGAVTELVKHEKGLFFRVSVFEEIPDEPAGEADELVS